jgi:serine/threonine-protein kinase
MLSEQQENQLHNFVEWGLATRDEVREARRLLEQAQRVGWPLTLEDALTRAGATLPPHAAPADPAAAPADAAAQVADASTTAPAPSSEPPAADATGATPAPGATADGQESESSAASTPAPPATPAQSDAIDPARLRLVTRLGRGSQAVVYKCVEEETNRILAVKILSQDAARNREARDRFIGEGRQAARLVHPHIVRIFQVGPFRDTFYMAMEYMDGGSVADLITARGHLSVEEASRLVRDTAEGLAFAHSRGFIHRDIKPRNLLLNHEGVVKLADLGVARRETDIDAAFAEIGKTYGTPYYISPEQAKGDLETDLRADIYSLGATYYEMLAGRPPFVSKDMREILRMHVSAPVPDPRQFVADIPLAACRILHRCLLKKPQDRFPNAEALIKTMVRAGLASK